MPHADTIAIVKRGLCALLFLQFLAGAQDFSQIRIERISKDHKFTEGPLWSSDGFILFSDIPDKLIYKVDSKGKSVYRENSNGANGNAYDSQGRLLSCESHTRKVVREEKNGKMTVIAESFEGKRFNAPNDIVVRQDGHIYFTDPAFGKQADDRDLDFYGVFHITPRGVINVIAKPKGRPNGIAISPNGRTLYVANSDEHNLRAYDLDRQGNASNEKVLVEGIAGTPDGMTVDEKGNLYVTAKSVFIYTPDGKPLATIEIPETPTNITFGDSDLKSLYITAQTSVYKTRVPVKGIAASTF